MSPVVYTPAQAAEILGCSVRTVLRAIKARRLPAFYVSPQRPRIPQAALERFMHERSLAWAEGGDDIPGPAASSRGVSRRPAWDVPPAPVGPGAEAN